MSFIVEEGEGLSNGVVYFNYTDLIGYIMKDYYWYNEFYINDECVLTEPEVMRAGVSACKTIDKNKFSGKRSNVYQSMEWPRCNAINLCHKNNRGCHYRVPSNIIPKEIKEASIIMTLLILKGDVMLGTNSINPEIKSMSLGKMSVTFKDGARIDPNAAVCGGGFSAVSGDDLHAVRHLLNCYVGEITPNVSFIRGY